jgi:molecular chaperone DnaK (HSP70)
MQLGGEDIDALLVEHMVKVWKAKSINLKPET